jgi:uncharacterized C2H2 Zn-finger protein
MSEREDSLLVYCISGARRDSPAVRSLCSRMVCTRCGMIGADVRPDWSSHVNKRRGIPIFSEQCPHPLEADMRLAESYSRFDPFQTFRR